MFLMLAYKTKCKWYSITLELELPLEKLFAIFEEIHKPINDDRKCGNVVGWN